ncbi:hypothetical protein ACRXCV_00365 (plasmid) [Halobacteriovorax sp. GFR7]|uniref:hypothetical protein n=1 Tax=unclassified Halobacteriovorax TaxID=2639665 RepID=UPI003D9875B4
MNIPELYTRPAFNLVSLAPVPLSSAGLGLRHYLDTLGMARQPTVQAFAFYYLDHCVALIKSRYSGTVIPDDLGEVVDLYHALTTMFGSDMYAYLFLICNREFRYCRSSEIEYHSKLGDTPASTLGYQIKSNSSTGAYDKLTKYTGDATLGAYCEMMTTGYYQLKWDTAYGGKKWGDIAKVLENYVLGRIPLMTLLDQSFSLQHNTCAIFNKGTVYEKESSQLVTVLDLQHAGQIINLAYDLFFCDFDGLLLKNLKGWGEYGLSLKQVFVVMAKHFDGLDTHVNWDLVTDGKYATPYSKLGGYKKHWYTKFGIYTTGDAVISKDKKEKGYYQLAPKEKYTTFKRTKK